MTDPSGSAKTLALPAGFDAPRLLRYDDVTAHAITRDDLGADVRGINASLDLIRETRGGTWPTGPVTEEEGLRRPGPARDRSFTLTAELENPSGNAEGILVTVGGETGGYALVVQDAKPTFHYNWLGRERYAITSTQPLPDGPCTIRFDFAYDEAAAPARAAPGHCRSTTSRSAKAASTRPSRSSSRPTTPSTSARTGARRCRRPTSRRSSSPAR